MRHGYGFSLLELLFALTIAGILLALIVPGLGSLLQANRVDAASRELVGALAMARAEAALRGSRVTLTNQGGQWDGGWQLFVDTPASGSWAEGKLLLAERGPLHRSVRITGNGSARHYISYLPGGQAAQISNAFQAGSLFVCPAEPGQTGRRIILSQGGRVRVEALPPGSAFC